jgi:hypothetical protein
MANFASVVDLVPLQDGAGTVVFVRGSDAECESFKVSGGYAGE